MKKQRDEMTPEELADDIFSHLSAGDFTEFETERLIEEIFTAGYQAACNRLGWRNWDTDPAPQDGRAKLIVWFKGPDKHLAVAWRDVELFKEQHSVTDEDRLAYWMYLTDPEEGR